MDPLMRRILMERELALRAGDRPEVVEQVAGRGGHRVVSVREQHGVAVADRVRDCIPLGGVPHLLAENVWRTDHVDIDRDTIARDSSAVVSVNRSAVYASTTT